MKPQKSYGSIPSRTTCPPPEDSAAAHASEARVPSTENASWWSRLLFAHANPLLELGNARQLNHDDLWLLQHELHTRVAFREFKAQYARHGESLWRALWVTYGWDFFICGVGSLVQSASDVFAPVVLHHLISALGATRVDALDLALWLGAFFASRLVKTFVSAHVMFRIELTMLRLTVSLKSLIFEKAMRRSVQGKRDGATADISNLFTSDMATFFWFAYSMNALWILPIKIAVVVYMLHAVLGVAAFVGAAVMVLSLVLNYFVSKVYAEAYKALTGVKDGRMKTVKEVFGAIEIVKLNAWEDKFQERIRHWRAKELAIISRYLYMVAAVIFLYWSTPICVSVVSFAVYALVLRQTLTATTVFTSIMLFSVVGSAITDLPRAVQSFVQARVTFGRVVRYLRASEVDRSRISLDGSGYSTEVAVSIEDVCLSWNARSVDATDTGERDTCTANEELPTVELIGGDEDTDSTKRSAVLSAANLEVLKGDLVVVHGVVGAGKSSLCLALLGEIPITHGRLFLHTDNIAYYSQQPWIQNMSVRDNILFGQAFDADRYARVLDACCLLPDLQQFPAGDATEIGQRGINLSGGQKARLSLARACYSDAEVFILDSPLAAVDAVVQGEIFRKCLCELLERKTVVLVTHNPEIILSDAVDVRVEVANGTLHCERTARRRPRHELAQQLALPVEADGWIDGGGAKSVVRPTGNGALVADEERPAGRVSGSVFRAYLDAVGGYPSAACFSLVLVVWQCFQVSSDLWLSYWTEDKEQSAAVDSVEFHLTVYALLGAGASVMVLARSTLSAFYSIRASTALFEQLTQSLLRAPLRFFDANPIGRLINRFAEDIATIDLELQYVFFGVLINVVYIGSRVLTAFVVIKYASVAVPVLGWVYLRLAQYYLEVSREITRMMKVANSPVLSHVTSCEDGVTVLRAFDHAFVQRAIAQTAKLIDGHNRVWYAEALVDQWFSVRIQLLGCALVMLVVSSLVWLRAVLSPGLVGLAFVYAVTIDNELATFVQVWGRLELAMVSPERVMEYVAIEPEGQERSVTFDASAHPEWPHGGSVVFEDVVFGYKPGAAPVLKGVSFEIREREKVGIVGRTGAGKSSLTMALFRINELVSGRIMIDGVDISSVQLSALRGRLSIIPQSPVLFKGTMRAYMDPFEDYSDAAIWAAFEKTGLKDLVGGLDGKLEHEMSENGESLSVGERQMLCLARALLRKARVVVLDEATASIDHATEARLQAVIAREFAAATVLTIAHRLATVLDCERVLVMDGGRVVEFGTPRELAHAAGGAFHELAREGGYLGRFE